MMSRPPSVLGWALGVLGLAAQVAVAAPAAGPDGRLLFLEHCAPCHGENGRGNGPDASLFVARPRDLREGFLDKYDDADLVKRILEGAPLALALDPKALRKRNIEVDAIVGHLESIPDVNWTLVERGQEIYVDRCEHCHGPFGRPGRLPAGFRLPRDLSSPAFQREMTDDAVIRAVRHGTRKGMPAIPALRSDADARALLAYVRVLSPGFELYSRHCAACHGDDGRPQREFVDPLRRPTVVFDRGYVERRNPEQLRAAVGHMLAEQKPAMPHFATQLSEPEAQAIVQYLRRGK
jgi:mono/diheme cytochrome c family protein